MNRDIIILIASWAVIALLLLRFTPKNRIREAIVIFFFKQFITWVVGLIVVELKLIEYPVRSFPNATRSSFDFEFFVYPSLCVLFNLHYPQGKSPVKQFMHYFYYCTAMTVIEALIEKYTDLITYIHWEWYTTWITLCITFYVSRKFYLWFFKLKTR